MEGIEEILEFLRTRRQFDAAGYCAATFERGLTERVQATGAPGVAAYARNVRSDPAEIDRLIEAVTVKVGSFFRDPLDFALLRERVLPAIVADREARGEASLRIWSAGCAYGEEAYTAAIVALDAIARDHVPIDLTVLGTDVDETALARARAGVYEREALANVPFAQLGTYFTPEEDTFRVGPRLRAAVSFSRHDLLDQRTVAPPAAVLSGFDLVLCRNVLIYYEPEYQAAILDKLHRCLVPGGYLMLGTTEALPPDHAWLFGRVCDCCRVYRRRATP